MSLDSVQFRRGKPDDEEWLFKLFRETMQQHIDAAWGWEELLQREGFVTTLPARGFQILYNAQHRLGNYYLLDKTDHLLLEMILVEPQWQKQGFGSLMMEHIKHYARHQSLPVQLRVLKTNPAVAFHRQHGFREVSSDAHSLVMAWGQND